MLDGYTLHMRHVPSHHENVLPNSTISTQAMMTAMTANPIVAHAFQFTACKCDYLMMSCIRSRIATFNEPSESSTCVSHAVSQTDRKRNAQKTSVCAVCFRLRFCVCKHKIFHMDFGIWNCHGSHLQSHSLCHSDSKPEVLE